MPVATVRLAVCLLMTSFVSFSAAFPPLDVTGTGNKHHVIVTWSMPDVAGAHASRPTTDDVSTADSSCDDGKLPTGSGNRKQK